MGKEKKKQESTQQINYSWMVCELCEAFSQAASASITSVQTHTATSDITACGNTTSPALLLPSLMGIRDSSIYLDYSRWCFSLFWLKRYSNKFPRHSDDIILVMCTNNKYKPNTFFGLFLFFSSFHRHAFILLAGCHFQYDINISNLIQFNW